MKSSLSIVLVAILIFLLGGVAGAVSYCLYCEHIQSSVPALPKGDDVVDSMANELQLDAQQKAEVKVIITDIRTRYRALSQEFRPRWEELRKESDERINALLREDQKPKFEKFLKRYKTPASSKSGSAR
ncbi:MAG: hypothetical protein JXA73_15630 [Acidobacteria bacterium]|nr:hypothetical protein [Acidobacteriota bacterium]